MTILGIVALSMIPKDSQLTFNIETAADRVEQDIRYARDLANISNTNTGIIFTAGGTYSVYQQATSNVITDPLTKETYTITLSSSFKNVSVLNNAQFEFDSLGRPVIGSGQNVQIGNGSTIATLTVTANTGIIQRQ